MKGTFFTLHIVKPVFRFKRIVPHGSDFFPSLALGFMKQRNTVYFATIPLKWKTVLFLSLMNMKQFNMNFTIPMYVETTFI